ncbi:zinc ribbon domain-containing protein [Halobacillus sp. BBL2006]|uniref:zinc ribbon domain-containing protein n=1 Tax=Halobacillus sp. BBL2006 TaxID=1543706 RepID=UPI000543D436|nr:zinc ribbon domain-containing protein [Halobacillus sp. BBL2006]KHE68496.1 hypothetical protein LD39_14525 [Halobacillus sp. BBL2006]
MTLCPHCGTEVHEDSRFCSQCGTRLNNNEEHHIHKKSGGKKSGVWLPVLVPVLALLVAAGGLFWTYSHQQEVNEQVIKDKEKAEQLALDGKYEQAEKLLVKTVDRRPDFQPLQEDLNAVQAVLSIVDDFNEVEKDIEANHINEAEEKLTTIQNQIQEEQSQLFATLTPKANHFQSQITIRRINDELNKLTEVDELAAKLNTLSGLNLEETAKVRRKINEKIVSLSTNKAEDALEDKQYNEAVAFVDQGLQYVSNHEKLIQLKERIKQEREAFEQAQHDRMEDAMQQAAKDELKNQNAAIEVVEVQLKKDEYGDIKVNGKVKSVATQILSTVTASYEIRNEKDEVVKQDSAKVYPVYLNPGDKGTFEKVHYDLKEGDYTVEVTDLEWLVE